MFFFNSQQFIRPTQPSQDETSRGKHREQNTGSGPVTQQGKKDRKTPKHNTKETQATHT